MNTEGAKTNECPLCGKNNKCNKSHLCWCFEERFPNELFQQIPMDQSGKSCVCKRCLETIKAEQRSSKK
ncbi:cysteine-rich CWC family protein [Halalkalibacter alkalisediminis]|uniref:Cysteine-rich CWC family protein n=1 Tax=Halalkalibacter alkalisediminis TaxID=935616 RepID=A0ABV6NHH7_9BACI